MLALLLALLVQVPALPPPAAGTVDCVRRGPSQRRGARHRHPRGAGRLRDAARRGSNTARRVKQQILTAAGLDPMPEKTPLNPQRFGKLERDGYTIEKVLLETWPGLLPRRQSVRADDARQASGRRLAARPLELRPARASAARVDARCARPTSRSAAMSSSSTTWSATTTRCRCRTRSTARRETLWAFGPLGLQLWDSIRVVDYVASLPEVDASRIGATGASGGGTQTFLLAAVDDRIAYAAPVNMVSAYMQGGSYCENAPGLAPRHQQPRHRGGVRAQADADDVGDRRLDEERPEGGVPGDQAHLRPVRGRRPALARSRSTRRTTTTS